MPMIMTGTVISFMWLLYGLVTREYFAVIQNGFIFLINIAQLSLFVIYPSKVEKSKENGSLADDVNNNSDNKKKI